ncbi:MAG TPA: phosphoglucomutase/phosphomannomutase family protein [Firmicutes bacterium]|uniref:Phosphoglucomutase n=1 Tax=Capillibacterium thermochitinicola TaxID=2699427 RepID=A0A8J6HXI0_9FIRM|nr:phosphoglucomutase/phosphomannomutase family protein [Capillibacterium thermochitinicola]MBA2133257.1 phosphoglucomutase/phosphomannomutase family protein [Capillibacterium thermochitinicola]HHW13249.1 phosphoglucomutase/phosphomannomutase family protein [Bacillota bacterium]
MIKFGTGGWRAIIGEDFTKDNVCLLAQGIADLVRENATRTGKDNPYFVLGYDRRFLSDKAAKWLAEVLAGNDIKVYFIKQVAPTPLVMYTVKKMEAPFGATITASHNPADYNGVKLFTAGGRDAKEEVTSHLESLVAKVDPAAIRRLAFEEALNQNRIEIIDPFNDYIDTILGMIDTEAIKRRKLRIVLDPMYGVSKTSLQTILVTTRCEVMVIHDRHDTLFGGRLPSPTTHTLHRLRNTVVENGFDLGIGTDGDADRIGIINEQGDFIAPNQILALLYYYLLRYKGWTGPVVRNLSTTHLLDAIARDFGEECYEVPVGFKYISAKMEETNALIGGESSGGLTIRGHIPGKDGIFAASLLIEALSITGKSISELLAEIETKYGTYRMAEKNISFPPAQKTALTEKIFSRQNWPDFGLKIARVGDFDGLKIYFATGEWLSVRFSGTEPLLRIYAEATSEKAATDLCEIMATYLGVK